MNRKSLLARLALVIVFAALAVGFISSQIFYRTTYLDALENAEKDIERLFVTVSSTAAIAAYVEDEELAKEVVNGLVTNRIIKSAYFDSTIIKVGEYQQNSEINKSFDIYHPFLEKRVIARLVIQPDIEFIQQRAESVSFDYAVVLNFQGIIVVLLMLGISSILITVPLSKLTNQLKQITPGESERIITPPLNEESEIGDLVRDINRLLEKTENQINRERELRAAIESLEKRFRMLFENSTSPIALIEPRGTLSIANEAFRKMIQKTGLVEFQNFGEFMSSIFIDNHGMIEDIKLSMFKEGFFIGEYQLVSHESSSTAESSTEEGDWYQVLINAVASDDEKKFYLMTFNNITHRKQEIENLSLKVDHDGLTGIYNRAAAERKVQQLIQNKTMFAFILIDLNDFKIINDNIGHAAGDEVLKFIAGSMESSIRQSDFAVRWGGDEFVLIVEATQYDQVRHIVNKIKEKTDQGIWVDLAADTLYPTYSVGVVFYPDGGSELAELYEKADVAMYRAKKKKHSDSKAFLHFYNEAES